MTGSSQLDTDVQNFFTTVGRLISQSKFGDLAQLHARKLVIYDRHLVATVFYASDFEALVKHFQKFHAPLMARGIAKFDASDVRVTSLNSGRAKARVTWQRLRKDGSHHSSSQVDYYLARGVDGWKIEMIEQLRELEIG